MNRFMSGKYFIIAILVVGLFLRLVSLNQSLWLDEATTGIVSSMSTSDFLTKFLPGDFHPPLYYLIIKLWTVIFGYSETALRIPSVIFGVATIFVVYKIAKNYYAPLLVATSGLLIYYSQEARMYSLVTLLTTLSVYFFVNKKWIWFAISILFLGMTDYVGLFILPIFWILAERKEFKKLIISHLPLLTFFLLWMPIFISQLWVGGIVEGSMWWKLLGVTNFKNIALIPVKFLVGRISFDNMYLYTILILITGSLYGYLIYRVRHSLKLIWFWLFLPIIFGILISFKIPTLSYFRYIFCLPALYILIGESVSQYTRYSKVLFTIILAVNLLSSVYYLVNYRFQREDWRTLTRVVNDDIIILPSVSQTEALTYYNKIGNAIYYKSFDGSAKTIWLSRYVWQIFDPNDEAQLKIQKLGYNKEFEANFNGVEFWKYTK